MQIVTHFGELTDLVKGPLVGKRLEKVPAMPVGAKILTLKPIQVGNRTVYYVREHGKAPEEGIIATTLDGDIYKGVELNYFKPDYKQEILSQVSKKK